MTILLDMNQLITSNIFALTSKRGPIDFDPTDQTMIRKMILGILKQNNTKFKKEYGKIVCCFDGKGSWRREFFPAYKAQRAEARKKTLLDWNSIYNNINVVMEELIQYMPYPVICVPKAEADDVIGVLVHNVFGSQSPLVTNKSIIVSADQDFVQLQIYSNIAQFDPTRKRFIKCSDPEKDLIEHILEGDRIDGIPNVLSDDNCFIVGKRQTPLRDKIKQQLIAGDMNDIKIQRNRTLIDLLYVPEDIAKSIIISYEDQKIADRSQIFTYFMSYRLRDLIPSIQEF